MLLHNEREEKLINIRDIRSGDQLAPVSFCGSPTVKVPVGSPRPPTNSKFFGSSNDSTEEVDAVARRNSTIFDPEGYTGHPLYDEGDD